MCREETLLGAGEEIEDAKQDDLGIAGALGYKHFSSPCFSLPLHSVYSYFRDLNSRMWIR
jgi:hypothetical protein